MPNHTSSRKSALTARVTGNLTPGDLPGGITFQQLLLGAPFRIGGPEDDGADLATWLLDHHVDRDIGQARLANTLQKAVFVRAPGSFLAAARCCQELARLQRSASTTFNASAALFVFFAAALGSQEAARCVAAEAIRLAEADTTLESGALELRAAALGWLSYSAIPGAKDLNDPRHYAQSAAKRSLDDMARAWQRDLSNQTSSPRESSAAEWQGTRGYDRFFNVLAENDGVAHGLGRAVVLKSIGGKETPEGGRVAKAFGGLVGNPLPLVPTPDLRAVRAVLLQGHPHAGTVIDAVLSELVGRQFVRLPPLVFLGPPGTGKTSFCMSLLKALGVSSLLYSCGGVSDSSLGGTSRRWQTGEPCTPVSLMSARQVASPGIVLDELEKAACSNQNLLLLVVLCGILYSSSAACWHDPYLEAEVDLSHVVWLATANSVRGLPRPLLDRCRILRMPVPGVEHLPELSSMLLQRAYAARNLDERWAHPLDGVELAAVAAAWRGGSIRQLARLLDGVLATRNVTLRPN